MLEVTDLHVYYGQIHALKGISFRVAQGEIVTLLGNNGAGKTTTLRTLSGLLAPRFGEHLEDEPLQNLVDQRTPVGRGDLQSILGVFDRTDTQDLVDQVRKRAGGPSLETGS